MRLLYIPGFGEDALVFSKLHPLLDGEKVFVDHWKELSVISLQPTDAKTYALHLKHKFNITQHDVVIGHSLGGWIGLVIKQETDCELIQIASWTDHKKVFINHPVFKPFMYFTIGRGWAFYPIALKIVVALYYREKASLPIFKHIIACLRDGDKKVINTMLRMVTTAKDLHLNVLPNLKIHALSDIIVRHPDEVFVEVPGDHFSLYTHPAIVSDAIVKFLSNNPSS